MDTTQAINEFKKAPFPLCLQNGVMNYAWGQTGQNAFIPSLTGLEPTSLPYAELWVGAHPQLPSKVNVLGIDMDLNRLIEKAPQTILGEKVAEKFNNQLPYLLKVLAADRPLSIQAHPDKAHAKSGFEAEESMGLGIDSQKRHYKDQNHKPEVICGYTDFYALAGFRQKNRIATTYSKTPEFMQDSEISSWVKKLEESKFTLKEFFYKILSLPQQRADKILSSFTQRLKQENAQEAFNPESHEYWMLKADEEFCTSNHHDKGLFAVFCLNLFHLRPGQALFLPPGQPHSYLNGVGIELTGNSDNVMRAGLTSKHINVDELIRIVTPQAQKPEVIESDRFEYKIPTEDFRLDSITVDTDTQYESAPEHSAEILLIMEGNARLACCGMEKDCTLKRGCAVLIPAKCPTYSVFADSQDTVRFFRAYVPSPN